MDFQTLNADRKANYRAVQGWIQQADEALKKDDIELREVTCGASAGDREVSSPRESRAIEGTIRPILGLRQYLAPALKKEHNMWWIRP